MGACEWSYYATLSGLPQQTPERDDGRHAGTVQEEEGRHALQTQGIFVVWEVVWCLALDVQEESSKEPAITQQKIVRGGDLFPVLWRMCLRLM